MRVFGGQMRGILKNCPRFVNLRGCEICYKVTLQNRDRKFFQGGMNVKRAQTGSDDPHQIC
jgi:hypothetical protein